MPIKEFLLVGCGGALGSMLRYGVSLLIKPGFGFPLNTFIVNMAGSFLIGILAGLAAHETKFQQNGYLFLAVGLCGGFTTFSAFSLEGMQLLHQNKPGLYMAYTLGSITLGIVLTFAGSKLSTIQ
jgi:CrcB protein